jgi:hypothetical protein
MKADARECMQMAADQPGTFQSFFGFQCVEA